MDEMFDFAFKRDKLYKQVADRLQQLIVEDALRPGNKLPSERVLAERMGVSRTVIREAIRVLSDRGLVKVKSGCGTYVQELSHKDAGASIELFLKLRHTPQSFQNVFEVRRMIEVEIAELAATRATEADIEALETAVQNLAQCEVNVSKCTEYDLAFHTALAAATHNDLFGVLLSAISDLLKEMICISFQAPNAVEDGLTHHRTILTWIKARDPERARQAMHDHLAHAQDMVERAQ